MYAMCLYALICLPILSVCQEYFTQMAADIIFYVREHLNLNCVSILENRFHNQRLVDTKRTVEVSKQLSRFMVTVSITALTRDVKKPSNVTNCSPDTHLYILLTVPDNVASSIIYEMLNEKSAATFVWLIFLENIDYRKFFSYINTTFDDILIVDDCDTSSKVYKISTYEPTSMKFFREWSLERGLANPSDENEHGRSNLAGLTFKAVTLHVPPVNVVVHAENETFISGYYGRVWKTLESNLGFKTRFVTPPDSLYGTNLEDGSWNGMIGMVERGEVDFAVCDFTKTPERNKVVDFSTPVLKTREKIFIKYQTTESINWFKFQVLFDTRLSIAITFSACVCGIALATFTRVSVHYEYCASDLNHFTLYESMFFTYSAMICQQGHVTTPRFLSCRIVFLSCYIVGIVLFTAYCAKLISFLATKEIVLPFNNLVEFHEHGSYELGMVKETALHQLFRDDNDSDSIFHRVYMEQMDKNSEEYPEDTLQALERVCVSDRYAVLESIEYAIPYFDFVGCEIMQLPSTFSESGTSIIMKKNSPFLNVFNSQINKLRSSGVLRKLYEDTWKQMTELQDAATISVDFYKASSMILVNILGIAASICILLVEKIVCWFNKNNKHGIPY